MLKKNILNNIIFHNYLEDPWKEGKHLAWSLLQTNHLFFSPIRRVGLHLEKSDRSLYKYKFVACLIGKYVYSVSKQVKLYSLFLLYFKKLLRTSFYRENSFFYKKIKLKHKFNNKNKYKHKYVYKNKSRHRSRRKIKSRKYKIHVYLWYKKWFKKKYKKQRRILWKSFHQVSSTFWGNLLKKRIKGFIFRTLKFKKMKGKLFFKTYDEITKNIFSFMIRKKKRRRNWKNKYRKYKLNINVPVSLQRIKFKYKRQNYQNLFPFFNKIQLLENDNNELNNNFFYMGNNLLNSTFLCFPKIHLFFINYSYYFYFLNLKNKNIFLKDKSFIFSKKETLVNGNDYILYFYYYLSYLYKSRSRIKIRNKLIRTGVLINKKTFSELQHGKYINIFLYWFDCFLKKHAVKSKFIIYKLINQLNLNNRINKKYNMFNYINCINKSIFFCIKKYNNRFDFLLKRTQNRVCLLNILLKNKHRLVNRNNKKITSNKKWYKSVSFNWYTRHKNRKKYFYPFPVRIRNRKKKISFSKKKKQNKRFFKKKKLKKKKFKKIFNKFKKNFNNLKNIYQFSSNRIHLNKLKKPIYSRFRYKQLIKLKTLSRFKNKIKINRIKQNIKIKKVGNKSLFFKSLFLRYLKIRKKNSIFYKKKNKKLISSLVRNRKIVEKLKFRKKLKRVNIFRDLKIHKHKRDIFFDKNYKFNRYLNFKKKRRHFLKKYKRNLRRKLYFISQILPRIKERRKRKKKKRDQYFKNKRNKKLDKKLILKFKTYFKSTIKKKNKKRNISLTINNKKVNNILLTFLLFNYSKVCKDNKLLYFLKQYTIINKNRNNIENIFIYIVFIFFSFSNIKIREFEKFKHVLNKLISVIKFYTIKRDKKNLKRCFNFLTDIKNKFNLVTMVINKNLLILWYRKYFLNNIKWVNKRIKYLRSIHKKLKFNKNFKRFIFKKKIKIFLIKYKNLINFKKYIGLKCIANMIRRNTKKNNLNKKKLFFNVDLNVLKNKKAKRYIIHRKKYMYKYYNKFFRISPIYKELLIHFVFRLKFKFRNINRSRFRNLKFRINLIEGNFAKHIFENDKFLFFLNNEKYILSNLCIISIYYNNMYSRSLVSYYDWISLEYSKYYFLNWFSYSNKMLENSYIFKNYSMNIN